jgi:hypothetical protein
VLTGHTQYHDREHYETFPRPPAGFKRLVESWLSALLIGQQLEKIQSQEKRRGTSSFQLAELSLA